MTELTVSAIIAVVLVGGVVIASLRSARRQQLQVSQLAALQGWTFRPWDPQLHKTIPGPHRVEFATSDASPLYGNVATGRYRGHEITIAEHSFPGGGESPATWNVVAVMDLPADVPTSVISARRLVLGQAWTLRRQLRAFTARDPDDHGLGADVVVLSTDLPGALPVLEQLQAQDVDAVRRWRGEWQFHDRSLAMWTKGHLEPDVVIERLDRLIDTVERIPAPAWSRLAGPQPDPRHSRDAAPPDGS